MAYRVLWNKQVIHSNLFLPFSNEVKNCTVMKFFTDNMLVVGVLLLQTVGAVCFIYR